VKVSPQGKQHVRLCVITGGIGVEAISTHLKISKKNELLKRLGRKKKGGFIVAKEKKEIANLKNH